MSAGDNTAAASVGKSEMGYVAIHRHKRNPAQCLGHGGISLQLMERDGSSSKQWAGSPQDIREGWERTAAGWAEADGSHTGRQGGDVERVWALERQTSWNPGSVHWLCGPGCSRSLS